MKITNLTILAIAVLAACSSPKKEEAKEESMKEKSEWVWLFNGENLDAWKLYNGNGEMSPNWTIEEDGSMKFTPSEGGRQNIVSVDEYTNFLLSLEWKIAEGGNSGIFWGVKEDTALSEPYLTGPEIQVLDNERHPDAEANPKFHQAGALYDMVQPSADVCKPAGEWNKVQIQVNHKKNKAHVKLNGTKIVEFKPHGPEWDSLVAKSKFADWGQFGKYQTGKIGLQDHGDVVYFRNIKIKEL